MTRYARLEVNLIAFFGALATVLTAWLAGLWAIAPVALTLGMLSFYRDPPRRVPKGDDHLLAPADGRIIGVDRGFTAAGGKPRLRIAIFLSVLDVHVNRAPCAGRVLRIEHRAGQFLNALRSDATDRNERNDLELDPDPPLPGPIVVRQIAGLLARRIVCAAAVGQNLAAGERFGMIKLGSQTMLIAPEDPRWEVCVQVGQRVAGGTTILARLRP